MKKTMLITLIIGMVINIVANLLVLKTGTEFLLVSYVAFPILWLGVGYVFKFKKVEDPALHASIVTSPMVVTLFVSMCLRSNLEIFFQLICRAAPFALLCSILILEYKIYKHLL